MDVRAGGVWCAVIAMVVASCGSTTSSSEFPFDPTPTAGLDETGPFCARWDTARSALTGEWFDRNIEGQSHERDRVLQEQTDIIESVDPLVPASIRATWDTAADFRRRVEPLLLTVGFDAEAVRPVHLETAFGDPDQRAAEAAEQAALAAVEEIDRWTVTNCGDLCARWPEIEHALLLPGDGDPMELYRAEADAARLLEGVEPLVPAELRAGWREATEWRALWTEAGELVDPDRPRLDVAIEEVLDREIVGVGGNLGDYVNRLRGLMEPLDEWIAANCGLDVGTGAEPTRAGTLRVDLPDVPVDVVGTSLLMLVTTPGTAIWPLPSTEPLVAAGCEGIRNSDHASADALGIPSPTHLCNPNREERHVLEPGRYDVHVLVMNGLGDGGLDGFLPAPERCASFPVTVDGDTVVEAPALGPCSVGALAGDPSDHPERRRPPVDSATPGAGTLTVLLDGVISPIPTDDPHAGRLIGLAVDAGIGPGDIGRGEAWPAAATCTMLHSPTSPFLEGDDGERAAGPVPLPFLSMPAVAGEPPCLDEITSDRALPDGVLLAPGTYSIALEMEIEVARADDAGTRAEPSCFFADAVVDGDVVVEAPPYDEWEACP